MDKWNMESVRKFIKRNGEWSGYFFWWYVFVKRSLVKNECYW